MTRHTVNTITSDALDALYEQLETAEATESQRQLATARAALASATTRAARAETALTRAREAAAWTRRNYPALHSVNDRFAAALDEPGTAATEHETTARVFAALHRSAEQDVTRVIDLYEQWVKAGPPPLGTPTSRWWDRRLAELHNTIRPPTNQPEHHTGTTPANQTAPYDQTNRPNQHRT